MDEFVKSRFLRLAQSQMRFQPSACRLDLDAHALACGCHFVPGWAGQCVRATHARWAWVARVSLSVPLPLRACLFGLPHQAAGWVQTRRCLRVRITLDNYWR